MIVPVGNTGVAAANLTSETPAADKDPAPVKLVVALLSARFIELRFSVEPASMVAVFDTVIVVLAAEGDRKRLVRFDTTN